MSNVSISHRLSLALSATSGAMTGFLLAKWSDSQLVAGDLLICLGIVLSLAILVLAQYWATVDQAGQVDRRLASALKRGLHVHVWPVHPWTQLDDYLIEPPTEPTEPEVK